MSYQLFLSGVEMPVIPRSVSISAPDRNTLVETADDRQMLVLHGGGLRRVRFELLLPQGTSTLAPKWYRGAKYYLDFLSAWKAACNPGYFVLIRNDFDHIPLFTTEFSCVLSEWMILEDARSGLDITVSVTLSEYPILPGEQTASVYRTPAIGDAATIVRSQRTYMVRPGDTLWGIARMHFGDGSRYTEIMEANPGRVELASRPVAGTVLYLP